MSEGWEEGGSEDADRPAQPANTNLTTNGGNSGGAHATSATFFGAIPPWVYSRGESALVEYIGQRYRALSSQPVEEAAK